jgi:hypothetical protein
MLGILASGPTWWVRKKKKKPCLRLVKGTIKNHIS